ncbi:hypothetical protein MMC12_004724 [Toensbergia leucococca]|nr:hypothetical protein [Toensbergia leucococca]
MTPLLREFEVDHFKPVAECLDHGEYRPNLLNENSDHARLENTNTDVERVNELVRCGVVYYLAQMVELPGLQKLDFFQLVFISTTSADEELHLYLINYIANHYDEILEADSPRFTETMKEHAQLDESIYGKLGVVGQVEGEIKEEENVGGKEDDQSPELPDPDSSWK